MVVTLEGGCRVSEMRDGQPLVQGTVCVWRQIGRATGAQAISLSVMEFAPGLSPIIQNHHCDQILYVVRDREEVEDSGEGQAPGRRPLDQRPVTSAHSEGVPDDSVSIQINIDGQPFMISLDTGIYIRPNQTFAIENSSSKPITIISSQCPDPDREPQFINSPPTQSTAGFVDPLPIVRLADQRAQPTADRWYRVLIDEGAGSTQVTQFVGSIPRGRAPDHFHNYEEVLFILQGEGRMWAGESNTPIAPGSCIYLSQGQVHCIENTGDGELRLLGVFYPAGSPSVRYDV